MTEQQQIYMRQIQDFQGQIDSLSDKKAEYVARIPKDQSPQYDTPEQAADRKEALNLSVRIGETITRMQAVQRLLESLDETKAAPEPTRIVTVNGYYGPMTLRLTYCGRPATCDPAISEEESRLLPPEDVQEWYEKYGWPRNGLMQTRDKRGRARGMFRLEVG